MTLIFHTRYSRHEIAGFLPAHCEVLLDATRLSKGILKVYCAARSISCCIQGPRYWAASLLDHKYELPTSCRGAEMILRASEQCEATRSSVVDLYRWVGPLSFSSEPAFYSTSSCVPIHTPLHRQPPPQHNPQHHVYPNRPHHPPSMSLLQGRTEPHAQHRGPLPRASQRG